MALAKVYQVTRFIGICPEHPHWATPSLPDFDEVERLTIEHNEAEHEGIESK